jgi:hypothetical protein
MTIPRRQFLYQVAGAAALPAMSRIAGGAILSDAAGAHHRSPDMWSEVRRPTPY